MKGPYKSVRKREPILVVLCQQQIWTNLPEFSPSLVLSSLLLFFFFRQQTFFSFWRWWVKGKGEIVLLFFLAEPNGMRDLSFQTRDGICVSWIGSTESYPLDHQDCPSPHFLAPLYHSQWKFICPE